MKKTYDVTVGWKLSPKSPVAYEETFSVPAESQNAAMVLAGFALARHSTHAESVVISSVRAGRGPDEELDEK
jgi:hypothetical protein